MITTQPVTQTTYAQPYLFFGGCCEEALDFYRSVLGARVEALMRYGDSPEPAPPGMIPPGYEHKILHTSFRVGKTTILASDSCREGAHFSGFSLSLSLPTKAEAERVFALLGEGGQVQMPLTETFWSPCFGMLTDRFGVGWMVTLSTESAH